MKIAFVLILLYTPMLYPSDMAYRYNIIRPLLDKYQRPFTVLEITTQPQALSFSIAHDYDAVCVVAASDDDNALLEQCHLCDTRGNILLLKIELSPGNIWELKRYSHFDVVLIWDIWGLLKKNMLWLKNIKNIFKLGDHIILETPNSVEDSWLKKIKRYLRRIRIIKKDPTLITFFKEITRKKETILQFFHKVQHLADNSRYKIISSFEEKKFLKRNTILTDWNPGINLQTFQLFNGVYPEKKVIRKLLEPFKELDHPDLLMRNIIIQGKKLIVIDWEDQRHKKDPTKMISEMIEAFGD